MLIIKRVYTIWDSDSDVGVLKKEEKYNDFSPTPVMQTEANPPGLSGLTGLCSAKWQPMCHFKQNGLDPECELHLSGLDA